MQQHGFILQICALYEEGEGAQQGGSGSGGGGTDFPRLIDLLQQVWGGWLRLLSCSRVFLVVGGASLPCVYRRPFPLLPSSLLLSC